MSEVVPDIAVANDEVLEEEQAEWHSISELQNEGINQSDIAKLKDAGCSTVKGVLMLPMKMLLNIKGISEAKAAKIIEAANKLESVDSFVTAFEYSKLRQSSVIRVTTGSTELNAMLGGGIESQSITEVYGEYRTGKTQLCHTLAVTCQLPPEHGGAAGRVAWIDTEGTFRPERIREIAETRGLDANAVLENIAVCRAYNSDHQQRIVAECGALFADNANGSFKVLVIDSIMSLFRSDYSGRGELAERQQRLNQMLSKLTRLASEFNIAIICTNGLTANPGAMAMADPNKPIGGHILAHAANHRIYLKKGRGDTRVCKLVDSCSNSENDCLIQLAAGGVIDATD